MELEGRSNGRMENWGFNLYSPTDNIRQMKSMRITWPKHVARMERREKYTGL